MMKWAVALLAAALACGGARAPSFDSAGDDTADAGASLFANADFAAAASADEAWLQSHPGDTHAELRLAAVRLYENRVEAAEPLLLAVISKEPQNTRATRLLAELNRRQEEARRHATVSGESARVPFVTSSPLPVVRAIANGRPANFLIDTGADVILEPAFAGSIGIHPYGQSIGTFAGGKHAPVRSGMLHSLSLGAATANDVPVHVLPTHVEALFPSLKIDGIVGTTYFERFLVTIDYPDNQLILRPRTPQVSAAFQTSAATAGSTIVPFYLAGDHFVFARAQVNHAHQGTGTGGAGAVVDIPLRADRVAVGSAVQHDVLGLYTPQGSPLDSLPFAAWGIISNDFLRNYSYTVDFDAMRIVLAPPLSPPTALKASSVEGPPSSASQIFDESFAKLQSYPVPPYAIWTATWHIRNRPMGYYTGESSSVETHRYAVRLADGMENVSDPSTNGKLPPALIVPEFLGPFAWRLRASVHLAPAGNGAMMAPDVAGMKTIAHVVAVAKPFYTFAVGPNGSPPIEDVGGRKAYHLQLLPKDSPQVHNLRDLWIDVSTYDLLKAHFVGTYAPVPKAPLSATDVTVYFRGVLGCWIVSHALWNYDDPPIRYDFDVQNDEIGLPPSLPDWLFDQEAYRQHQLAGDSDYLGQALEQLRKSGPGTQR
ncbi:MAG TPA: aspartyl protease family protein [Candidatus Cybelea sp.]|jgi:hypothetical protein